ncbi:MAG: HD-GYP domain-containing protein [Anaerolineales bacterium]
MKTKRAPFTWQGFFRLLSKVESQDPDIQRKGQLLALFIGLCWLLLVYSLLNTIYVYIISPSQEYLLYLIENLIGFIPLHIFWGINRKGRVLLAANLSITFTILATAALSDAKYMEYLMVIFALPIGISSFIIRPASSFSFTALTALCYTAVSIWSGYAWEYNLTAILALLALAIMTWATARLLDNTLEQNNALVYDLQKSNYEIQSAYETTLEGWSRALEIRDRETQGHTKRVTDLTLRIAKQMGFNEEQLTHIHRGVLLHDIGKIGIPDDILHKPGPLNEKETHIMRLHPQISVDLLSPIEYLKPAMAIPKYHHEKWDGSGYPHGLSGEMIPLEARIFAIVDVYDAISHDRPYRKAWSKEKVIDYIKSETGKHFDPAVTLAFLEEVEKKKG